MKVFLCLAATLSLAVAPALAHEFTAGALQIIHPHSPATGSLAKVGGGYFAIANDGPGDDRLLGIRSPIGNAMLHESTVDAAGVARMTHLADGLPLPAGEMVVLEPGGLHVMFVNLTAPLVQGQSFPATLVFENAGEVTVEFHIEALGDAAQTHGDTHAPDPAGMPDTKAAPPP